MGLLLYIAVTTRPHIAFAVLRLASFLINPGPLYHKVANKVIGYLISTKDLALYFRGSNDLEIVSDTLLANNTLDRKNSQAFIIKLFKGLIL